jgi:hypothetical protein
MANSMREKVGEVLKGFLDSKTSVLTKQHEEYKRVAILTIKKLEDEKRSLQSDVSRLSEVLQKHKDMTVAQFIRLKWRNRG